jgi:structural phage protein
MAVISTQTRKVTDLPQTYQVNDSDNIMIHDGRGLKKVSVQTLKNGMSSNVSVATSSSNGIVRPDNYTTEVVNGAIKAKTATSGQNGVVRPDNSTITVDGSGVLRVNRSALNIPSLPSEIVAHKLINQNGNQQMKYWFGSRSQYESISYKDPNTIYDVYE